MGESEYTTRAIIDDFIHCRDFESCNDCNAFKVLSGFNNSHFNSCQLLREYLVEIQNKINYLLENEL